ncbi:MAG: bifunctional methylenetetrahydrofolate dehydrogenase/methenyltetrahydrofolate cyclohydrolase FolD [Clostridiales bacterium]|nr:bifunctional methylenetetrahydrofolate dehydrogenase/methenyltetrahydrofolate cyclohydrolase FolD [Clostridiales bacterium]
MIIDGKLVSEKIRTEISKRVQKLQSQNIVPGLAVIIVGDNPASQSYVRSKQRTCEKLGMYSEQYDLDADVSESELLTLIEKLNNTEKLHGILVQLPLPKHIDESRVIEAIDPRKDVDCFHPLNVGKLTTGVEGFKPCTPAGIIELLAYYEIELEGKEAVVLGRSNIVGKPIALMLLEKNATVTICHSRTKNLETILKRADIIVAAIGKPHFLKADMVKEGAVIIDVGINRIETGLVGDVAFEPVQQKTSYITPVPGGVGPMTITMLMKNTLEACEKIAFDAK